jgi:hypothetical protein
MFQFDSEVSVVLVGQVSDVLDDAFADFATLP